MTAFEKINEDLELSYAEFAKQKCEKDKLLPDWESDYQTKLGQW